MLHSWPDTICWCQDVDTRVVGFKCIPCLVCCGRHAWEVSMHPMRQKPRSLQFRCWLHRTFCSWLCSVHRSQNTAMLMIALCAWLSMPGTAALPHLHAGCSDLTAVSEQQAAWLLQPILVCCSEMVGGHRRLINNMPVGLCSTDQICDMTSDQV